MAPQGERSHPLAVHRPRECEDGVLGLPVGPSDFPGTEGFPGKMGKCPTLLVGQRHKPPRGAWPPFTLRPWPSWRGSWLLRKTSHVNQGLWVTDKTQGASPLGLLGHTSSRSG